MASADIAKTTLKIEAGFEKEYLFISQGHRVVFPGFLIAYSREDSNQENSIVGKDLILPSLKQNQKLETKNPKKPLKMEQLYTKPPPRYSEASLVKKLESEGIGRPSTYALTISTIQERGYVEITPEKKLKPTSIGEVVTDFLTNHFSEIINLGFTAKIERNFDRIAQGEEDWVDMMSKFYKPFNERVEEKDESVSRAEVLKKRIFDEPDLKSVSR
jgi:Topoisomerase IA